MSDAPKVDVSNADQKDTSKWVELVRISPKVEAVQVKAGSLLAKGGDLVIKKDGDVTVVVLQHSH